MTIRVLHCIARMNVGGPAVIVNGVIRESTKDFEQLLLYGFCSESEREYLDTVASSYAKIQVEGFGRKVRVLDDFRALLRIRKVLAEWKPDILHTHTFKAGFLGRLAALTLFERPILVHTFHGHLLTGYFNPFFTKLISLIERLLAYGTSILVSVGEKTAEDLVQAGIGKKRKYRVIYPGVEHPRAFPRQEARQLLQIDFERFTVGFVGRLAQIKRIDRFLEALALLPFPVQAVVAGDGDERRRAEAMAKNLGIDVHFLGWREDLDCVFSACDTVVLTSDNEGSPLSLIEAQLRGIPTVSTDVGNVKNEIIRDGETGFVVELSPRGVAAGIERVSQLSSYEYELMSSTAKIYAGSHFSMAQVASKHLQLYRELCANGGKR